MSGDAGAVAPLLTQTLDRCLGCGGTRLLAVPLVYEFRGRFPAARCARCGLCFLRVQPAPEALAELYSAAYFESDFRCGRSDVSYANEPAFRGENAALVEAFAACLPSGAKLRRLLEVGCAGGWLLKLARERGWDVRGVEVSADAVTRARALGLDVHHGGLSGAGLPAASFEVVYMGDVLEHVPDCRATLAEVARVLAPGGCLYLRGPITTHSLARRLALAVYGALGRSIVLREPPYHLWEFTPRTLTELARGVGLDIVSTRQTKIAPGRGHGRKTPLQTAAMFAIDAVNQPLTSVFNVWGDRMTLIARRPA